VLFVLATGLLGSIAKPLSPPWDDMHTMHSWNDVPKNWESLDRPPSGTTIDLYIALKSYSENALIDALYEVSEPTHPRHVHHRPSSHAYSRVPLLRCRYGAHLSKEQVAQLVAPHPNTLELVNSWLEHHGVPPSSVSMTHGGNTLELRDVSVAQADALLDASYQLYRHVESSETIVRTVSYALPAALNGHVLTVVPTTSFATRPTQSQTTRNRSGGAAAGLAKSASGEPVTVLSRRDDSDDDSDDDDDRDDWITPSFLRWLYNTSDYTPAATDRNMLGIVGFFGDYPSPADLTAFMREYRSDAADAMFTVEQVNNGGYDPTDPHEEANMDTQYAEAMAYPTPLIFYSAGKGPSGKKDPLISWLKYILKQPSIPQTISVSYYYDENTVSKADAVYMCRLFAQLGARGVSVLFPSGNDGVGDGNCVTPDGVRFIPAFPATCTCGVFSRIGSSTQVRVQDAYYIATLWQVPMSPPSEERGFIGQRRQRISPAAASRTTLNAIPGSNRPCPGFSGISAAGIRAFTSAFACVTQPNLFLLCTRCSAAGRGVPDIAAQSKEFRIFFKGHEQDESGTSIATPVRLSSLPPPSYLGRAPS